MSELFLKILNLSISASWLIPVVLLLRLLLKKAPKWCSICLWAIVALRLLLPFSIESVVSLIPSAETISPTIMTDAAPSITSGIPSLNSVVNPVLESTLAPTPGASVNPLQVWIPVAAIVWALGIACFAVYTAIVYLRLRRKVATAVRIRERENIYQSENVSSPFLLGIVKPRIYLPFNINEQDIEHVIAHEQAHIKRRDHWWKPLGFLLLAVYWFNPLLWLAYILLCRDIELACDEKVIKQLENEEKAAYTEALVACSVGHRLIAACPLAFGEVGVKERVRSVMNYKKPALWIIILAIVACAVVAVCFLTNPAREEETGPDLLASYLVVNDEMVPSTGNGQKIFNSCMYIQLGENTYRYKQIWDDPASVTVGEQLYRIPRGDFAWHIYAIEESPDYRTVYVDEGGKYTYLYRYYPPQAVDPAALEVAKESGCVVMENGDCTVGAEIWDAFYKKTQKGKPCSVRLAEYYTLDPASCTKRLYDAKKEDYPFMAVYDIGYDGKWFTVRQLGEETSYVRRYKCLMKYEDVGMPNMTAPLTTEYVLTHSDTVTWDQVVWSMFSSDSSAWIDCFRAYTEP